MKRDEVKKRQIKLPSVNNDVCECEVEFEEIMRVGKTKEMPEYSVVRCTFCSNAYFVLKDARNNI